MAKPRYAKQRDKWSCGPTALLNVLKWAGYDVTYKDDIGWLSEECGAERTKGTFIWKFDRALRHVSKRHNLDLKMVNAPSSEVLENHVRGGGLAVVYYSYSLKDSIGHYMLINSVSPSGKSYTCINDSTTGPAVRRQTKNKLNGRLYLYKNEDTEFTGWLVSKENL